MAMNIVSTTPKVSPVQRTALTTATIGSNAVVAAKTGQRIRVLGTVIVTTLANSIDFLSASTAITGIFPLAANGGFVMPFTEHGWCETEEGEALNINLSVATSTGIQVLWQAV
jgi:hypothetical protein